MQIAELGHNNIRNLFEARVAAEKRASGQFGSVPTDDYVRDWKDGADGLRFTADDTRQGEEADTLEVFEGELSEPVPLKDAMSAFDMTDYDWVSPYVDEDSITFAGNLRTSYATRGVPIEEALQKLVFRQYQTLRLYDEAYMPYFELKPGAP